MDHFVAYFETTSTIVVVWVAFFGHVELGGVFGVDSDHVAGVRVGSWAAESVGFAVGGHRETGSECGVLEDVSMEGESCEFGKKI